MVDVRTILSKQEFLGCIHNQILWYSAERKNSANVNFAKIQRRTTETHA